jgi:transposase-like protein
LPCSKPQAIWPTTANIPPVQYLNNVLEQDHRAIKRRINASQHFRSFWCAWRTIAGYKAIHLIRKGQAYWSAAGAKVGLVHRFILVCSRRPN